MQLNTKLSLDKIRDEAGTRTNFIRGAEYFRKHKVAGVRLWRLPDREDVEAEVSGSGGSEYTTTISISDVGEIETYDCTCPAHMKYGSACKHIVALLLYRYHNRDSNLYRIMSGKPPYGSSSDIDDTCGDDTGTEDSDTDVLMKEELDMIARSAIERTIAQYDRIGNTGKKAAVNTDYRIKSLIDHCVADDVVRTSVPGDVRVVPKLELNKGTAFLSITVGRTRQYVVKNMETFCYDIKACSLTDYGKELKLVHHIESFEEESRPLVRFILRKQDEKNRYFGVNDGFSYRYSGSGMVYGPEKEKRNLKLLPAAFDELFELLLGTSVSVGTFGIYGGKGTSCGAVSVSDQSPELYLEIKELENKKGFALKLPDCEYVLGEKHVYIYCDAASGFGKESGFTNTLCRFSEEISEKIAALAAAQLSSRQPLLISNADMPSFYSNVLTELKTVIEIRGDLDGIGRYAPDEMQASVYLDSPQYDAVTAVLKYQYGDVEIDPNDESERPPETIARDEKKERIVFFAMNKYFNSYDPGRKFLFIQGDDDKLYEFVTEGLGEIANHAQIFASDRFKNMGVKRPPQISVGVKLESDLLNIELDTGELPLDEAMSALDQYKQKRKYYRMKDGSFLKLDDAGFSELADMVEGLGLSQKELTQGRITAPKYRALYLDSLLKNSGHVTFERDGHFKGLIRNMKAIDDSDLTVPESLSRIMREYQKDGFRWLATMDHYGFGGILADDMGLGKTLEMISLILSKKEEGEDCSTLVVSPASLVLNWQNEVRKFAPELRVLCVMGTLDERKALLRQIDQYDVVITSYDLLKRDIGRYQEKVFRYHIVDEAQYIKNQGTQNAKAVKAVKSVQRFALTGTPVENRLSELWSIFDFLMPSYLYSYKKFKEIYETDIVKSGDRKKTEKLSRQVAPFMLRRLKTTVLKELPEKMESVVFAQMEGEQKKLYLANLAKARSEVDKKIQENSFDQNKIAILALLTRLRQICCHPALCYEDYKKESAKLEVCMELLLEAAEAGHKVLLFSQFTTMLDLIEQRLSHEGVSHFMLTGSTPKEKRIELVDRFNGDDTKVFLISLKAGGTGLNLVGADVVIHYDPWWNLAAQNQATDRTHRIGQKNSVQVYKLIEKGSIEEKILLLQENKKNLADAVIRDDLECLGNLSPEVLMELLRP